MSLNLKSLNFIQDLISGLGSLFGAHRELILNVIVRVRVVIIIVVIMILIPTSRICGRG